MFGSFMSQVDTKVLYIVAAIVGISLILALIKKAAGLAIVLAVLLIVTGVGIPKVNEFQEKFSISMEESVLKLKINGEEMTVNTGNIDKIKITAYGLSEHVVSFSNSYGGQTKVSVPSYMTPIIQEIFENKDVDIEVE